jgi:phosphoribosylanthranilate isomerase
MVKVKICGVTRQEDLDIAIQAGVDSIGFIVDVTASPRNLSFREAKNLIDRLPSNVDSVAVTVFNGIQRTAEICQELTPNFIQLHRVASEPCYRNGLASRAKIIIAVDVGAPDAIEQALLYSRFSQAVLVDTHDQAGRGGTGLVHNWSSSRKIRDAIYPVPMILAGGLTPENVGHAVSTVRPYGVDVSTGVEVRPRVKDPEKMTEFIRKARETAS